MLWFRNFNSVPYYFIFLFFLSFPDLFHWSLSKMTEINKQTTNQISIFFYFEVEN